MPLAVDQSPTQRTDTALLDKLSTIGRDRAVRGAAQLLDALQLLPPEDILAALAVNFYLGSNAIAFSKTPEELYHLGRRIAETHVEGNFRGNDALQSLKDFYTMRVGGRLTSIF